MGVGGAGWGLTQDGLETDFCFNTNNQAQANALSPTISFRSAASTGSVAPTGWLSFTVVRWVRHGVGYFLRWGCMVLGGVGLHRRVRGFLAVGAWSRGFWSSGGFWGRGSSGSFSAGAGVLVFCLLCLLVGR